MLPQSHPKTIDKVLQERLDCAIETTCTLFDTEKIILFGKYARLCRLPKVLPSEIDILVIAKTDLKFTQRIRLLRENCNAYPPINPLIYTPAEVEQMLEEGEGFLEDAFEEGITIYPKSVIDPKSK